MGFIGGLLNSSKMGSGDKDVLDLPHCSNCGQTEYCHKQKFNRNLPFQRGNLGVMVFVILFILHSCSAQNMKIDVRDYVHSMEINKNENPQNSDQTPVSLKWGIADTSATVGRLFNHVLPDDAFKGTVLGYKVTEAGKNVLPGWLHFDELTHQLRGIPTPSDIGQHYLEVVVKGFQSSEAKDVFSVTVTTEMPSHAPIPVSQNSGKPQHVKCTKNQPETAVTIIIDADMNQLSVPEKIDTMNRFTEFLNLGTEMLKLLPLGNKPMFDSSALVAGPGDSKAPKTGGMMLSWLVGCGKVEKDHMTVLQNVESTSANGRMKRSVGHSIIGWHVTNTAIQEKSHRRRRQIRATATAVMTPSPPTGVPEKEVTATEIAATETSEPLSRTVPSVGPSPSVTMDVRPTMTEMIKPTKTIEMPSASPGVGIVTDVMMTKSVTAMPTVKPVMTTDAIAPSVAPEPEPEPEMTRTQILPTKTYVVTDAPTEIQPITEKPMTEKPSTKKPVTEKPVTEKPVTKAPTTTTTHSSEPHCPEDGKSRPPVLISVMEELTFQAGRQSQYQIPEEMFFDCKYGTTSKLSLNLFIKDRQLPPPNYWLALKRRKDMSWRLVGMPFNDHKGKMTFTLTAQNPDGLHPAISNFKVTVLEDNRLIGPPSHEISLTLDEDYNKFNFRKQNDFLGKLAGLFGQSSDTSSITVLRIAPGSVIFAWTNNSLPTDECAVEDIQKMTMKFMNEDGTLKEETVEKLRPYRLSAAAAVPMGACKEDKSFPHIDTADEKKPPQPEPSTSAPQKPPATQKPKPTPEPPAVDTTDSEVKDAAQESSNDEIWITTVVPAVVIVAILLIALIIACILYRKKRKGKMSLEDQHTFVNKGAPVIFPDEYDEKPNDSTKPLIMDEEKPPMPPPEYTRASSESSRSSENKNENEVEEHEMDDCDATSPLYQPPPPVPSTGNNKQPRPHIQPAYKNPTPYVPP